MEIKEEKIGQERDDPPADSWKCTKCRIKMTPLSEDGWDHVCPQCGGKYGSSSWRSTWTLQSFAQKYFGGNQVEMVKAFMEGRLTDLEHKRVQGAVSSQWLSEMAMIVAARELLLAAKQLRSEILRQEDAC